ncbi:DUF2528 family protein [Vibrio parahaemolyticus]|nr:DUF2528 family protein [Vibrio parahaemolyticus]MCS0116744.1 DUF2528 family protein [Vibrio parahaemolyticus]
MGKVITLNTGLFQKEMEMTITIVDEAKFNKECVEINAFWCGKESRAQTHGSEIKAGLALFAAECFQQIAFNNFKDEQWLAERFDWNKIGIKAMALKASQALKIWVLRSPTLIHGSSNLMR